jgi:hypothetical protein
MRKTLIVAAALLLLLLAVTPAIATPTDTIEICHFPGHVQPGNPDQIDFILDLDLPYPERVEECTVRDGTVLNVHANAVSFETDPHPHGHIVDADGLPD